MSQKNFDYESLRADAIDRGEARWMYEAVDEPLPPEAVWEAVPDYYVAHVEEKNARVCRILAECTRAEAFVFFTDAHVRQSTMIAPAILRSILESTPVRDVIYGGDTVSAWTDEVDVMADVEYFARAYAFAKPYMVRGNHDMYGKRYHYTDVGVIKSAEEVYDAIMRDCADRVVGEEGKNYYYFDHPDTKTRYIVLDTNEIHIPIRIEHGIWECEIDVTEAQVQWFRELLLRTPRDWGIIVCGHIPLTEHLRWSHPRVTVFSKLIEAYNRRERVSLQAPSYRDGTFPVQADFTAAEGRVLMSICGHGHIDDLYVSPTDCIYVETHCESVRNNNGGSPFPRVEGTLTETVLDVCILERNTGKLHLVRYGAGEDRNV